MFEKHLWKSDILSKDARRWPMIKYFASKNQLPGLSVNRTLVENGLSSIPSEIIYDYVMTSGAIEAN